MLSLGDISTSGCRRHTKVYSGECFPVLEDRYFWVCVCCSETGSDRLPKGPQEPQLDPVAYWKRMRELKPDCWVPAKYR